MLKHVVMWTLKKEARGKSKEENLTAMYDKLMALPAIIEEIKYYEVGVNQSNRPSAFDIVLISAFENETDLEMYRTHPQHMDIADFIKEVTKKTAVVDYETKE